MAVWGSESDHVDERQGRVLFALNVIRRSPTCAEEQLFLADTLTCTSAACLPPLFLEKNSRLACFFSLISFEFLFILFFSFDDIAGAAKVEDETDRSLVSVISCSH